MPSFTPSAAVEADVVALTDCLAAVPVGDTCTYSALSASIGRDVTRVRHLLIRAAKRLNADTGAVFSPVYRVGYQRLAPQDVHKIGAQARGRMRRSAKRAANMITHAVERANDMPPDARRRAMAEIGTMSLFSYLSTDRVTHSLPATEKLRPVGETLSAILAKMGNAP